MEPEVIARVWITTLVIYAVVVMVVAVLLTLIVREARRVLAGVEAIWVVGQKIANNAIHIPLLRKTNHTAGQILESAGGIVGATAAVKAHAKVCPGCPACVLGPEWRL